MSIIQSYQNYTQEDHDVWSILFKRQQKIVKEIASDEFKRGFDLLSLNPNHVANLDDVNEILYKSSGWKVIGASGLIPNREFFEMLINKTFPITTSMRTRDELTFSELPDIFHDICGHVPMLMDSLFCDFMSEYSRIAIDYSNDEKAVECFGRLYWFTLEMGLVKKNDEYKPYGGAILTSSGEIQNIKNEKIPKYKFDLEKVINTSYDNLKLQKEYFYIESFHQLFDSLKRIKQLVNNTVFLTA